MDGAFEVLGYLIETVLFLIGAWVVVPPIVVSALSKTALSGEEIRLDRSLGFHFATIPVLVLWLFLFRWFPQAGAFVLGLAILMTTLLYQPLILARPLGTNYRHAVLIWFLSGASPCLLLLIYCIIYPPPGTGRVQRAANDMRNQATALFDYQTAMFSAGRPACFPIPCDEVGDPVTGTLPEELEQAEITSASDSRLLYYRGPSFVPDILIHMDVIQALPADVFDPDQERRYGYGVGPLCGPSMVFMLSSMGPDGTSQAEELERLFFEKHKGDDHSMIRDPDVLKLIYNPSNGVGSSGDLYRTQE